ncbi:MAG: histidine kinase, partial [Burkholderiales bacterium]
GMDDYLTKPLQVAALGLTLEKWIALEGAAPALTQGKPGLEPPAEAETAIMDFSRLQEFKDYDDEHLTMTREVIALLLVDAPLRLDALDAAVTARDCVALAKAAHALKGASSNVGATALQQASARLEADAGSGLPPDAAQRIVEMRDLWERTSAALMTWA